MNHKFINKLLVVLLFGFVSCDADVLDFTEDAATSLPIHSLVNSSSSPTLITIAALLDMGQPVLIENIGNGKTMKTCSHAGALFQNGMAVDASVIGMCGCLVYNKLYPLTDLNNPLYVPDNIPASFTSIAKESGVVAALTNQVNGSQAYTLSEVLELLTTNLGYSPYTEDDEGNIDPAEVTKAPLEDFINPLLTRLKGRALSQSQIKSHKFHTGYNPSGGWEFNLAATKADMPLECVDSDPTTPCAVLPLFYDFDGTTLTENPDGDYVLNMEYRNDAFQDYAWVTQYSDSKPYQDSNFQRVQVPIIASNYSAIDSENKLYDRALNPMEDNEGNSAPYSNAAWRALYPAMHLVDNVYLFPFPDQIARFAYPMADSISLERLTALKAFTLFKMLTQGMAALPVKDDRYAFLGNPVMNVLEWDTTVSSWLNTRGNSASHWIGAGNLKITSTSTGTRIADTMLIGFGKQSKTKPCQVTFEKNHTIIKKSCKPAAANLIFDRTKGTLETDELGRVGTSYHLTGYLYTLLGGSKSEYYYPTKLLVYADGKTAAVLGDNQLLFTFTSQDLIAKITERQTIQATYQFEALTY